MTYDMKKMEMKYWENLKSVTLYNKKKILFHPLYNKKKFVKELYKMQMGKNLNINDPKTFTEKLNSMKLDKKLMKSYGKYIDKNKVRDYVSSKIGDKYLVPQYFYKRKINVSDLNNLPSSFVLKTTSGTNYIVLDKEKENLENICNYLNFLSDIEYGYIWGEFCYNYVDKGIVAEQLLLDNNGNIPDDLKCFCFKDKDGNRKKILYIERVVGDERERIMFDEDWKPVNYGCSFDKLDVEISKPKNYKEILSVIDKLSEDFRFVRVDLYVLGDKIYFGELTFIPTAGYLKFDNDDIDLKWGSYF